MNPHAVIVTMRDNGSYIKVFLYSYSTINTGWEGSPKIWYRQFRLAVGVWRPGAFRTKRKVIITVMMGY